MTPCHRAGTTACRRRRTSGCDDVETHLVDELLDAAARRGRRCLQRADAGTARALRRHGAAGRPERQRLRRRRPRATWPAPWPTRYLREVDEDLAWVGHRRRLRPGRRERGRGAALAGQRGRRRPTPERPGRSPRGAGRRRRSASRSCATGSRTAPSYAASADDPEDHFQPPPPPPLPISDRVGRFAWAALLGGPVLLVLAALVGLQLDGWVGSAGARRPSWQAS